MAKTPITVAYGDGIGPEIMSATLRVLEAAGAELDIETVEIGEKVYKRGVDTGMDPGAWDSLRRTRVFLKAPITTPQGGGYKSLNVTMRKALNLYANVRPTIAYSPFVETKHPTMDLVIIRENEEDLYAGIEHRQTNQVYQCLKLITQPGSERVIRYAFDYARANGRKKVTCFVKDNIMKLTDGLFHKVFDQIAAEYPDLQHETLIVDIGAARLANTPERFDVVVMPNLYGDILSDVTAEISGSVGLAPSANIGDGFAMFEAIHGSAPDIAGQNVANPSGLLLASVMMLVHIGQASVAERVHQAWLRTIEDGVHTRDIFREGVSSQQVGTTEFADAVIARLGQQPKVLKPVSYREDAAIAHRAWHPAPKANKQLVGVDVFLDWQPGSPNDLGEQLSAVHVGDLRLEVMTNRGIKVWPNGLPETFCTDHWRCRFRKHDGASVERSEVVELQRRIVEAGFDVIKTENLYTFDGVPGFSAVHG
ncbi:isocitrate dehydrogenase [Alicyclobacillus hesperidum URH17-3-68]|uniref:Isocitrate dehydrogenase [NADP] n=1 Tax=Alicyclobacillus hesperidum TaxID=89784 RepID=A0A1H2XET1_9BACL|nr:NADP-dependent isocitrate dehydrogenase [Alicyclobacillus hesperidum]EJY54409.1 isocitrate dehydrogenase [Alicyclobacillus hesperidum URH17-3-68]GLV13622.1 isocitrate dehydrogenase [Alicyclobacillus hesperidum]SDW91432.1 isocitrate dehydrogenase [Alicyclobacillus hesperidum]